MTAPYIVTSLGLQVPLLDPRPHDIQLRDIAHHLATLTRFSGAAPLPYSVAQHSVVVADFLLPLSPRHALLGLLHDAHEAYLGDMVTPLKHALFGQIESIATARDEAEDAFDIAIHARFGIEMPDAKERQAIGLMDEVAFATEWRDLMPEVPCPKPAPPHRTVIKAWPWHKAEQKFLEAFDRLTRLAGVPAPRNAPTGIMK